LNNNPPEVSKEYNQKKRDDGIVNKHVLINAKLQIGKSGQTTELTGRSPVRSQRFALECSAI
jgi:hypothetical protein